MEAAHAFHFSWSGAAAELENICQPIFTGRLQEWVLAQPCRRFQPNHG